MPSANNRSKFSVDPYEVARAYYDRQMQEFMVALLRHFKVTQVEIDMNEVFRDPVGAIEMRELENGKRFYRIIGELEMRKEP